MASDWDVYLSCCSEHGEGERRRGRRMLGVSHLPGKEERAAPGPGQEGGDSGAQRLFQAAGSVQRRKALPNSSHKARGLCLRPP